MLYFGAVKAYEQAANHELVYIDSCLYNVHYRQSNKLTKSHAAYVCL
jgi:hypothetical protein